MANLSISYDDMETTAGKMDTGKEEVDGVLEDIRSAVRDLTEEGFKTDVQSESFYDEYDNVTNNLKDAAKNIEDMATLLRDLRGRWEDGDTSV